MINGGVAELACRKRLRSCDMNVKEEEEEEHSEDDDDEEEDYEDDDEEEEDDEYEDSGSTVKRRKTSSAVLKKEEKRKVSNNPSNYDAKAKNKNEKRLHGGDDKTKYRKAPTTTIERERKNKSVSSHGREKKVHSSDHDKHKRRNTPHSLDKNKDSLNEKSRKIPSTHSSGKRIHNGNHYQDKRTDMYSKNKRREEKRKNMSTHYCEHKVRSYHHGEHKGRSEPHPFNNNEMQKNELKKKKNTPLGLSKENKTHMMSDSKKENKRKKAPEMFNKSKKMRTEDKDEKAGSGDRWKTKKKTVEGHNKEQKVPSGHKENMNVAISFFKLIYYNFEEFLLLPPVVAHKLMDLTNRRVKLQDSEGKFSDVRLSMVDGSLAFHQGWNDFVSDHSIKLGEQLLFEYTGRLQFSVRVFGTDSCERVCFSVERQGGKKQKGCHAPDETENAAKSTNSVSEASCVAVNPKEHRNRVVSGIGHGSSIALYEKDGYLANGKHKANDIFQTCSKGIILITDDEAPLTQENEDTEKLKTYQPASETHCVSGNTKEDPKKVVSGALCGPSAALGNKEGTLAIGECKTNCISSICSTEKTIRSEIIPVIDAAPLAQENENAVELTTCPLHIEDTSMMKQSEPEIATPAKCTEIQDSDKDLRRKQEGNTVQLECTTAVDKYPNNSKMNTNGDVCSKHEALGGSSSLEKCKKATVSDRAALDGTGLIKPEKLLKTEDKLVGNCSSLGLNSSERSLQGYAGQAALDGTGLIRLEKQLKTDEDLRSKQEGKSVQLEYTTAVDKCPNNSKMNTNGSVCIKHEAPAGSPSLEKWKNATVSGRAALDGTGLIKPEKLLKTEDKLVGNCSSLGLNSSEQSLQGYASRAALDGTGPIRLEKRLKTDEDLRRKQGNTVQLECTTAVDKRPNNSKLNTNGSVCSKHEAPGGSTSLEKWKNATVSGRAALDGTGLVKPEKLLKTEDKVVGNCSSREVNSVERSLQGYACRAALDGTGLIRPEKRLKTNDKLVGNCSATGVNPVEQSLRGYADTQSRVQQTPCKISKSIHIKTEIDIFANGKGPIVQPKTQMEQFGPMDSIACRQQTNNISVRADHAVPHPSEHHFFSQEGRKASHHVTPTVLLPVKDEILELDDHSVLKTNLQFCIPSTTQTWIDLPTPLSKAVRRKGRLDKNVVMLKDPMKRLWPVFYHETSLFVGFTRGWKPFVAANNLRTGDVCMLLKDLDEDELVYHVQVARN